MLDEAEAFFVRKVVEGLPMLGLGFEEGEDEDGESTIDRAVGGGFTEITAMFLVEGGGALWVEGASSFHDLRGVSREFLVIILQGGVRGFFLPLGAQFAEDVKGGDFAKDFFEPFVLVFERLGLSANVCELVCELVDDLSVVTILCTQLDGDLVTRGALEQGDRALAVMCDEKGGVLVAFVFWEDRDGLVEKGAEF